MGAGALIGQGVIHARAGDRTVTVRGPCAQAASMAAARASASAKRPPPGPSMLTKSVSQKVQTAPARSCSRPLHRLQPAKRRNTAGRSA